MKWNDKNWSNVIFADEKKYNLDGPSGSVLLARFEEGRPNIQKAVIWRAVSDEFGEPFLSTERHL